MENSGQGRFRLFPSWSLGKVKVERHGQEAARLGEGDYFGEVSLLVDLPAVATITTLEPCILLRLQPRK
jgi:CRP-like cAMP-binding protein